MGDQEDDFTLACGGRRVAERTVLDIDPSNHRATVLADVRLAPEARVMPSTASS